VWQKFPDGVSDHIELGGWVDAFSAGCFQLCFERYGSTHRPVLVRRVCVCMGMGMSMSMCGVSV